MVAEAYPADQLVATISSTSKSSCGNIRSRETTTEYDLVVVGGGAGGIAAARAGVRRGWHTLLIQDGRLGGDCTFTGCVPSKTLIEATAAGRSFSDAIYILHEVVEQIAATESAVVLVSEGIDVIMGRARFTGPKSLSVGDRAIRGGRVVVATGSSPMVPSIPGLDQFAYLTNETVFDLAELPRSLAVLGGGAIGCELAQVFGRFGTEVHIFEAEDRILPREEPEVSVVLANVLAAEGVSLHLGTKVARVERLLDAQGVRVLLADGSDLVAEQLLVAVGRRPATEGLDLAVGGIEVDERGFIRTDQHLRTSVPGVYAVGDVTGLLLFTHAADEMGRLAVANAFRRFRASAFDTSTIPWVTFTDPEIAHVGLTESQAVARRARVSFVPMAAVDRAIVAKRTEGFVKLIAGSRPLLRGIGGGELLGATIVAPRAGEMIHEVALAMRTRMFTGRLAQTVHAYPTWSTGIRQAAAQFFFEIDGRGARPAKRRTNE